jgi:hypothetical protein
MPMTGTASAFLIMSATSSRSASPSFKTHETI